MPLVILIIGASGIIAQIVLIRELLVVFQGNELSIGLILGNWLIAEALGSYLFRRLKISGTGYKSAIFTFALIFPLLIILTRIIRPVMGILPGEIVTIPIMFVSSFLILLPIGFLHGALFTSSVSLIVQQQTKFDSKIPGSVYIIENLGTIIGGVILSFLLIPYLTSLKIAFLFGIINLLAVFMINKYRRSLVNYFSLCLIILFGFGVFASSQIEHWTLRKNYPHYNILSSVNTIYSNITVINREEQLIFLVDGNPTVSVPYPDQYFIEDFVNLPLLNHPNPRKILLIGGGAGGVINHMLQYNMDQIVYLELDPFLIQTMKKFSSPLTQQELSTPNVSIVNTDARHYLENELTRYDLIFISFINPLSLQTNRFFTQEFFRICRSKLNHNGILVTITPGSSTYLSPTLNNVIASHFKTLRRVFPHVSMLSSDFNLFLSFQDTTAKQFNAETLYHRLITRNIKTSLFSPGYIQYRLQRLHSDPAEQENSTDISLINQDGIPRGLFYNLYYKNTIASPSLKPLFDYAQKTDIRILLIPIIMLVLILLLQRKHRQSNRIVFTIFTTGIAAMVFTLVLSLGFQIRYGYLYYQISILLTTFITGSVVGGFVGNITKSAKKTLLFISELCILILLGVLFLLLENSAYPRLFNFQIDFFIFLFAAGLLVGFQFPIANRILHTEHQSITSIVGKLYASDLLGGFISAIVVPVMLIPILGIANTLLVTVILKSASALLVLTLKRI
ncbi:MAG: fused MFS/spermidine synthase [Candidatus Latescibacteria bacterium]|nr:fused MFS/spermidine synthase [Candidatus Latescibacterota bacterium]